MRFCLPVLAVVFCLLAPAVARANCVPFSVDAPKTKVWYVLPGPYVAYGARVNALDNDKEAGFMDYGLEISVHRFLLPADGSGSIFSLAGYGALMQLSLGSSLADTRTRDDLGPTGRVALGGQTTFGPLGLELGLQSRFGSPVYASTFGAFFGGFVSLGFMSSGIQVEAPIASLSGEGRLVPWLVTFPFTLKWPLESKD